MKAYAATGDGLTDDTVSVQACLNAAGAAASILAPARVIFNHTPGSGYLVGNLTVPDYVTLEGPARLVRKAGGTGSWFTSTSGAASRHVTVRRLTFDFGNYLGNTDSTINGWSFVNGSTGVTFENNTFLNHGFSCVTAASGPLTNAHWRVRRNDFKTNLAVSFDTAAVVVWEPMNVVIEGNSFFGGGGIDASAAQVVALTAPTLVSPTISAGGSLTATTYYWVATCIGNGGETLASNEVSATVGAGSKASIPVSAIPAGTDAIKVYRSTSSGGQVNNPSLVGSVTINPGVTSLTFLDTGVSSSYQNIGAAIAPGYVPAAANTKACRDLKITDNVFEFVSTTCIIVRVGPGLAMENVTVEGNHLTFCGYYFASSPLTVISERKGLLAIGDNSTAGTGVLRGASVSGNVLRYFLGAGISVGHEGGGAHGTVEGIVVANNTLNAFTPADTPDPNHIGQGINFANVTSGEFVANTIKGTGSSGIIHPGGTSRDITISNNTLDTCAQSSDATLASDSFQQGAIAVWATIINLRIAGNTIRNAFGSGSVGTALAGIVANSGSLLNNVSVINNRVYDDRGTQYMQYALNIGNNAGGGYPTDWTVEFNDFSNGAGASGVINAEPIKWYAASTTTNRYVFIQNKGSTADTTSINNSTRPAIALAARGLLTETVPLATLDSSVTVALTSQQTVGMLVGLAQNDVVTGIGFYSNITGPAATASLIKVGLYGKTGTRLALSNDISASMAAGANLVPFTAPYTVLTSDGFYLCVLMVFSGTAPQSIRVGSASLLGIQLNSGSRPSVIQAGQADLPSSATFAAGTFGWWMAAY